MLILSSLLLFELSTQAARMYHVAPYSLGYLLAEIPYILFNTLLCVSIFYFMANLEANAAQFFWFYLFFMLNTATMVSKNSKASRLY